MWCSTSAAAACLGPRLTRGESIGQIESKGPAFITRERSPAAPSAESLSEEGRRVRPPTSVSATCSALSFTSTKTSEAQEQPPLTDASPRRQAEAGHYESAHCVRRWLLKNCHMTPVVSTSVFVHVCPRPSMRIMRTSVPVAHPA